MRIQQEYLKIDFGQWIKKKLDFDKNIWKLISFKNSSKLIIVENRLNLSLVNRSR